MLCSLGVKAGMVHECVAGKTVWSPCYVTGHTYLSALAMVHPIIGRYTKCQVTLTLTVMWLQTFALLYSGIQEFCCLLRPCKLVWNIASFAKTDTSAFWKTTADSEDLWRQRFAKLMQYRPIGLRAYNFVRLFIRTAGLHACKLSFIWSI